MAVLASVTKAEITGLQGCEVVSGVVTTSGDTYTSRFGTIFSVLVSDRTTLGGARASTVSGGVVTITCTNGDTVDLQIWGK